MNAFLADFADPHQWAAQYRALGLQVVPGKAGEKRPLMSWVEFQNGLVPQSQFDRWYGVGGEYRQNRQMGLLTGLCSTGGLEGGSGLLGVDLDAHGAASGLDWWRALVETHFNGIEPETWRARSGGGGEHIFFAGLAGRRCPTFKRPDLGVDARGQGGYVVVAPSIHPNGNGYEWVEGFEPWSIPLAWAPVELHDALDALAGPQAGSSAPREPTPTPASQTGLRQDDGREAKLAALVWAAVVDLYRESPIKPPQLMQDLELSRLWTQYEQTTRSRLPLDDRSNADRLEAEGRGMSELRAKWSYAMLQWETKVAEAAKVPKAEAPPDVAPATDSTLGEWDGGDTAEAFGLRSLGDAKAYPEPRKWVVAGWVPQGEVTLLSGDPGAGKSLLAMQLACSVAVGQPWLGLPTQAGTSVLVSCEDSADEIDARFLDAREAMGYALSGPFEKAWSICRKGKENRLTTRGPNGVIGLGPYYVEFAAMLRFLAPDLLKLDTLADFFTGNENDRAEVNWFVKTVLGGLVVESGGRLSPVILGHTSRREDSEFSGSSAWSGAVRSRLFVKAEKDGGPGELTLTRSKANYAGDDDDVLRLRRTGRVIVANSSHLNDETQAILKAVVREVNEEAMSKRPYSAIKGHPLNIYDALPKQVRGWPEAKISAGLRLARDLKLIEKTGETWRVARGGDEW